MSDTATATSQWHISNSGYPAKCRATVQACPRGRHFRGLDEAKFYTETAQQGTIKPVTDLLPMKAATERNADNLFSGRTRAGDIYEFTLSTRESGPRLDRGFIRNDIQSAISGASTTIAYDSPHQARIQLTIPEDNVALNIQEIAFDIAEVHNLLDAEHEESQLDFELTGYKSIKSARKLQPRTGTVAEVLRASEVEPAIHGADASTPEGYFTITTKVMGYTRTYLAKGDPADDEAPIIGRVDSLGNGHHSGSAGSGLLGGVGLPTARDSMDDYFQHMIRLQDEKEAKALARA